NPRIFEYALQASGASVSASLMLGDNYEADILGAKAVGLDTVFYNPKGEVVDNPATYDIRHWRDLMTIL
ncbi:MAG TPA: HAD hydrolase-like protein, partial [Fibrella sp.]